jgi:hypothetical protein
LNELLGGASHTGRPAKYANTSLPFPGLKYMKNVIGHDISLIYLKALSIIKDRSVAYNYLASLDGAIHKNILNVLSDFAKGDRYSNIDLLVGNPRQGDPHM